MSDKPKPGDGRKLNPDLKQSEDGMHDTERATAPPVDSTSTGSGEDRGWVIGWAVLTIVCVVIAIWLIL